jgi:hypothetical protein
LPGIEHVDFTEVMNVRDLAGKKQPPHRHGASGFAARTR